MALQVKRIIVKLWHKYCVIILMVTCLCLVLYIMTQQNVSQSAASLPKPFHFRQKPQSDTKPLHPPAKHILLVTYGRSGSTFTSYILNEDPDMFFFYEPLRPLMTRTTKGLDIIMNYDLLGGRYMEPQELTLSNLTNYEQKAVRTIEEIFNCDFVNYPIQYFRSAHFMWHGATVNLSWCLVPMLNTSAIYLSPYVQCFVRFINKCFTSKRRMLKVIRLPVRALFPILRRFPDLRVVYLVRDPRATLRSQRRAFRHVPSSQEFCRLVEDDVRHLRILQHTFPDRAFMVRYEDISYWPLEWTRRLYSVLGMNMTSQVRDRVISMTSASKDEEEIFNPFRSDSRRAADKWRTKIKYTVVESDDKACSKVYKLLGYRPALNPSLLRDLNESLLDPPRKLPYLL